MDQPEKKDPSEDSTSKVDRRAARKAAFTKRWGKRAGIALFMFFLIKGLLWLIVPAAIYYFGWGDS